MGEKKIFSLQEELKSTRDWEKEERTKADTVYKKLDSMREMQLKPIDPKDIRLEEEEKVEEHEDEFVVHEVEETLSKKPPWPKSNWRPANRQKEDEWRQERSKSRDKESPWINKEEEKKEKKPI